MEWLFLFQLYHIITGISGIVLNVLLLYVSIFRSPKSIKTYSILIINFALSDMFCAFLSLFIEQRIIPVKFALIHASYGFCHYLGIEWCYAGYSMMLHFFAHSQYCLLISFSYRYYILSNGSPKPATLIFIVFLVYIPSFVQCVTFMTTLGDQEVSYQLLRDNLPNYDIDIKLVSGNNNIFTPCSIFTILHMCLPTFPIYITILILKSKIVRKLQRSTEHLRNETKILHKQLLKALTYQATLPAFFGAAVIIFVIEQTKLLVHPILEFSVFSLLAIIPIGSPLVYLYSITPYRRAIFGVFTRNRNRVFLSRSHTSNPGTQTKDVTQTNF